MFGLAALFGRSREVQRLDAALRAVGIHPVLVPDAVKIAALKFFKDGEQDRGFPSSNCDVAAEMIAFCILGEKEFHQANGLGATQALEWRLQAALDSGDSLDARLMLLTLHAELLHDALRSRYDLHASDAH